MLPRWHSQLNQCFKLNALVRNAILMISLCTCPYFDPNSRHSLNAGNDTLDFATGSGNGFIERQTSPSPHGLVVETTLVTQNTSSIWVIYNQTDVSNAQHVGLAMQVRPVRTDGSLRNVKHTTAQVIETIKI